MQKAHYTLSQQAAAPASSYYQQQQYQQQQQQQYLPHLEPAAGGFSGTVAIHYGRKHSADDVEQHAIQVAAPASSYYQQQQYQQQQQQQYLPHLEPAAGGFSGTVAIHYGRKHSADDVEQHAIVSGSDYGGNVPVATTSHTPQPTTKRRRTVTPRSARSIAASAAVSAADSHIADITAPATVGSSPGIAVPTHQQQQQQQAQRYQPPELTATNGSTHSDELHCLAPPAELAASVSWAKSPPLSFKNDRYAHLLSEGELAVCEILRINPDVYLHVRHAILAAARHANRTRPRRLIPVAPGSYGARLTAVELNSAKGSTNTAGGGGNKAWLAAGVGSMTLTGLRKREAQKMCHIDVNKTSKLFDWYAELGWLHSPPLFVPPPSLQPGSHTVIAHSVLAPMALDNYDKAYREAHDIPEEPVATQTQQHQQPVQQQPIQPVQQQPVQQQVYKHQPMTATPPSGSPVDSTYGSPSSAFPPVSIQGYSPVTSALPPPTVPQFPPSPQSQTTCSPPTLIAPRCLPLPVPSAGSSFASRPPVTLPPPVPSRYIPQRSGSSSFTSSNIDTSINNHISMSAPLIPPLPVRYSPVTASTVPVSA
ncbi:hypothetical protein GQ42DRAFT_158410 [Ramicandelaber brevisporus]|nr:hypothetical protein GQ42DRAFT_158410 [Ramicandelaber brevisporus]